ncbi:uncharacterized protein LOC135358660 isoform X2 [Latimeria chalumnae]|uniref:uncharacterized protein LOC135358660 isoform X2 n=1 Tax=Latimeria chalumnae TaxID=7897 RepID=UPI00313C8D98
MSESSSGVITSSKSFPKSRYSDFSQTNISLPVASRSRESHKHCCDSGISSPLPSDRFKYVTWKDIKDHDVKGIQIHCARIREGPTEQELFLKRDKDVLLVKRKSRERELREERLQEDWENCKAINLSYQDLGDSYQQENFHRILHRLIRVENLQLVDNSLRDLSPFRLPRSCICHLPKTIFRLFRG